MEIKKGYKVCFFDNFAIGGKKPTYRSISDCGLVTAYPLNKWVIRDCRRSRFGPMCVFNNFDAAKRLVESMESIYPFRIFVIFFCLYAPSSDCYIYNLGANEKSDRYNSISIKCLPGGTRLADAVKLKEIAPRVKQ